MDRDLRRSLIIAVLLLCCYGYVLPRWADWSQNSRLNLLLALADDGTVRIDRYVANTGDYALYEGHAYTDKAPGPVFLALPAYVALRPLIDHPAVQSRGQSLGGGAMEGTLNEQGSGVLPEKVRFAMVQYAATLSVIALPAAILGALFFLTLRGIGATPAAATVLTLGYGLGSLAAPYAGNFYSHQLTAVLLFGAFVVAWRPWAERYARGEAAAGPTVVGGRSSVARRSAMFQGDGVTVGPLAGLLVGLLLGWSVISEYPTALPAAAIVGYALYRRGLRWLPTILIGGLLPGALLAVYDFVAFGTILPVGYAHSALWQDQHQTGFLSLTYPRPEALWGLLFGGFRGLFVRAPWLLLAFGGYLLWWRGSRLRAEWWVALLAPLTTMLVYSSSIMWWGGFAAGPRYITPMVPFLGLAAAWAAVAIWGSLAGRATTIALVAASVLLTWAEATAGQSFPTDATRNTWGAIVLPAWAEGDIARNLGMALGLDGAASLFPLILAVGVALLLLLWPARTGKAAASAPATPSLNPEH